jgi:hypothetical protein
VPAPWRQAAAIAGLTAAVVAWAAVGLAAKGDDCETDIPPDAELADYRIGRVEIRARWIGQTASTALQLRSGDPYSREAIFQALRDSMKALKDSSSAEPLDLLTRSHTIVDFVSPCVVRHESEKKVDVILRTFSTRFRLHDAIGDAFAKPRSPSATAFAGVPTLIRLTQPSFGMTHDPTFGTALTADLNINSNRPRSATPGTPPAVSIGEATASTSVASATIQNSRPMQFAVIGHGTRSVADPWFAVDGQTALSFSVRHAGLEYLSLRALGHAWNEPRGALRLTERTGEVSAAAGFRPKHVVHRVDAALGYSARQARLGSIDTAAPWERASGLELRTAADLRIANGLTRLAFWFEGRNPQDGEAYRKAAGLIGYEREIPVTGSTSGRHRHTVGVEATLGIGTVAGPVPASDRFRAGGLRDAYLRDDLSALMSMQMPAGPFVRSASADSVSATATGFDRFVSSNLTVSFPIPKLSHPLIPEEDVGEVTLKQLIKRQSLTSAKSFLAASYETDDGLSAVEADRRAEADIDEIAPAVTYIADSAYAFSLRPLLLLDVARLDPGGLSDPTTRWGLGGGFQLMVVSARFEGGYVRAVRRERTSDRGRFVVRAVFTNLF